MSREKGRRGELEVVSLARVHGLRAERTAQLQACSQSSAADVVIAGREHEVKRDERLSVDAMLRQADRDGHSRLIWRRNRSQWRVSLPLVEYLRLLEERICA